MKGTRILLPIFVGLVMCGTFLYSNCAAQNIKEAQPVKSGKTMSITLPSKSISLETYNGCLKTAAISAEKDALPSDTQAMAGVCMSNLSTAGPGPSNPSPCEDPTCSRYTRVSRSCEGGIGFRCSECPGGANNPDCNVWYTSEQSVWMEACASGDYDALCASAGNFCERMLAQNMQAWCTQKCSDVGQGDCEILLRGEVSTGECIGESFLCPAQESEASQHSAQ